MKACTAHLCSQGRRPCPQACALPDGQACAAAWAKGAGSSSNNNSTAGAPHKSSTLAATVLHLAVAGAAVAALVFIVKTAASA